MPVSHRCSVIFGVFWIAVLAVPLSAQQAEGEATDSRPNVFFDCDGRDCNSEYYRTEVARGQYAVSYTHLTLPTILRV